MSGLRPGALAIIVPFAVSLSACSSGTKASGGGAAACHYVVVGHGGEIGCSADGTAWSTRKSGTDQDLRGVAARQDGTVVAVGQSGTVLYSTDGAKTFKSATVSTTNDLEAAAVDDAGHFVIAGNDDHAYYSDDGQTWKAGQVIDPEGDTLITHLASDGSGRFLGSGTVYHGSAAGLAIRNRIYLSTDGGDSWSHVYDGDLLSIGGGLTSGLQGIATDGAHHYVAVGWKTQAFYAAGDPTSTWTASTGFSGDLKLQAVAWDAANQRFIAGDISGGIFSSKDDGQTFSTGCTTFQGQGSVSGIVAVNGRFLAVGPGLALSSSDGGDSCNIDPLTVGDTNLVAFAVAYLP